jgi:hypothetical protein
VFIYFPSQGAVDASFREFDIMTNVLVLMSQAVPLYVKYEIYACRMYEALLSSGGRKAAKKLLKTIPKEDVHVRYIIDSCFMKYYGKDFKLTSSYLSSKSSANQKQSY